MRVGYRSREVAEPVLPLHPESLGAIPGYVAFRRGTLAPVVFSFGDLAQILIKQYVCLQNPDRGFFDAILMQSAKF